MSAFFCDSSAIVKIYVAETGSAWISTIANPAMGNRIYVARITLVEVVSAISRREKSGQLTTSDANNSRSGFEQDFLSQFRKVEINQDLTERAAQLARKYALRGYDAIQLAAVLETESERLASGLSSVTVLSADTDLNTAAVSEGLTVDNPNDH